MLNKKFYRAFEDKYRGSRELIKDRISIYIPFILPLKNLYVDSPALDIGCGRGEWLELLKDNDILAHGIDFDESMLTACHQLGLNVLQGDGIKYLKEQESESKIVISAFHVVEHISFEDLQLFVEESLRVLKPGGLLIMETPNPENIRVATEYFYLDPTHTKPIPSSLLSFLPEFYGFARTKVIRLQESQDLLKQETANILQVIEGISPDYAVIAQKDASLEILSQFDYTFLKEYGLSLNSITNKFENRLLNIEAKASEAEAKASEAERRTTDALYHYHSVINSNSWKITQPLRILGIFLRNLFNYFPRIKFILRKILLKSSKSIYSSLNVSSLEKEFLIDVTHVYKNDLKTGIQRVVRSISRELCSQLDNAKLIYLTDVDGYWIYKYVDTPDKIVVPKDGDKFLGLDLNSAIIDANIAGLFSDWKKRGVNINFVIYDILPILHSEWWQEGISDIHEKWLKTILNTADKILCISKSVSNDVREYFEKYSLEFHNQPKISWFHLGADIDNSLPSKGLPKNYELILKNIESKISFLMVGTIEPRKGHNQTLKAFEKLWQEGLDVNLVIIGKEGWMVEKLIKEIQNHKELNKRLFWLNEVSDEYLEKIYGSSSCLISSSEGEGFGLPLIEAAQKKLPIIARNTPVFREVAGEFAYYFENDNDPETLVESIEKWITLYKNNKHPKSDDMPWLTWKKSTEFFLNLIIKDS
jgi:O-antigen chain-terminating methyltransferase